MLIGGDPHEEEERVLVTIADLCLQANMGKSLA
jgi:hypothetical protein